ncbi:CD225/dispanin family protein [Frankia nepalensis]|uniref:CD225/dispanin family protein n=1 Tax=Frankia nepalensis TaxID=1836974 RepID=UPI0027DCC5DD|nr:CD225/dispanin family protein [Frankia nepalensis]
MSQYPPENTPGGWGQPGGQGTPPPGYGPPPGGYGAPQEPGYGYGQPPGYGQQPPGGYGNLPPFPGGPGSNVPPPGGAPIPNYLWQSIVVTILCCIPAGIVAIVNSTRVQSRQQMGDIQGALDASKKAKTWCIVSLVAGLVVTVIYIILIASGAMDVSASYSSD